jgi:diguanylate cyclase (GGDEF)-like protein/PAS domain S-box-containing protein
MATGPTAGRQHAGPSGGGRFTLRARFIVLSVAFSVAIVVLVALAYVGLQAVSGARAYVHGESQWAKAQKQSVISLLEYALTGDVQDYNRYNQALEVIYGDRRSRLTLDSPHPDYNMARDGFTAGRNHPEDIELMIRMFEYGRGIELFDRAVEVWARADAMIDLFELEARHLHEEMFASGPGSDEVITRLERILDLDRDLTLAEDEFSELISQLSRQLAGGFSVAILVVAVLLMLMGHLFALRLVDSAERADRALRESEQRYRALVDQTEVGMWQLDEHGRISYLNPAMKQLLGLDQDADLSGRYIDQFVAPEDRHRIAQDRQRRSEGLTTTSELRLLNPEGGDRQVLVHGAPVMVEDQLLRGHVGTCMDITQRKLAEQQLRHQALHDHLTGLPNRKLFLDRLEMALRRARRETSRIAVMFIDLDRFKVVNDSMGHAAGDQLLCEVAKRLGQAIRERDTIARFGGDEFGLILENVESDEDTIRPAQSIIQALARDFEVDGTKARIGASIGIALSGGEHEAADLLRFADIAMYVAKRRGGGTWHTFQPEQDSVQERRLHQEYELWHAAARDQLVVCYQPIVDLQTGAMVGLEALVRWRHPHRGLLEPDDFISLAEETGAIAHIGQWVTSQAGKDLNRLRQELGDRAPLNISINISAAEFRLDDPPVWIERLRRESGLDPDDLHFEVSERLLTQRPDAIRALARQGFPVAIDNFGSGYASLELFREIQFSAIKLDRSFVQRLGNSAVDRAIVESVLQLAEKLNLQVIAEGVETERQHQLLRELGCQLGQGFLFARPQKLDDLLNSIQTEDQHLFTSGS